MLKLNEQSDILDFARLDDNFNYRNYMLLDDAYVISSIVARQNSYAQRDADWAGRSCFGVFVDDGLNIFEPSRLLESKSSRRENETSISNRHLKLVWKHP